MYLPSEPQWPLDEEHMLVMGREVTSPTFQPSIDLLECPDCFCAYVELPGVDPAKITIVLNGNNIVINGIKENPTYFGDSIYLQKQCRSGAFRNYIFFPIQVDPNQIMATFQHGVLQIKAPKLHITPEGTSTIPIRLL